MASLYTDATIGRSVKLMTGEKGRIESISNEHGFPLYGLRLTDGKLQVEARYRFDLIPETVTSGSSNEADAAVSSVVDNDGIFNDQNYNPEQNFVGDITDDEILKFLSDNENKSTAKKTLYDIAALKSFLRSMKESREIYQIPPCDLNKLLSKYFMVSRKSDGTEFEPNTLRGKLSSFERHLKRHNYGESLNNGTAFSEMREVLKTKQKRLKSLGLGNKANKSDALSDNEIEKMYQSGAIGTQDPETLLHTLWFYNSIYFGLRGVTEHHLMRWGDVELNIDSQGLEFLEFTERQTKTRTGVNVKDVRAVQPRAWANNENPLRCPVVAYKVYKAHRPTTFSDPGTPFYIATNTNPNKSTKWYRGQPVGVNKLSTFMKKMANVAGLDTSSKKLTNHSARKYLVQKLNDENVPATHIMQISGHKNIQSVNNYSHLSERQHRNISGILCTGGASRSTADHGSDAATPYNVTYTVKNTQENQSSTSMTDVASSLFCGPIYGGTFNIQIYQQPK